MILISDLSDIFTEDMYSIMLLVVFCGIAIAISIFLFKIKSFYVMGILSAIILIALSYFGLLAEFYMLVGFVVFAAILTILFMKKRSSESV